MIQKAYKKKTGVETDIATETGVETDVPLEN